MSKYTPSINNEDISGNSTASSPPEPERNRYSFSVARIVPSV